MRYHINPRNGEPNPCKAVKNNCPFGNEENHFPSIEAARQHFEKDNTSFSETVLYKYPRTPHLPFSEGATSDDKHITEKGLKHLKSLNDLIVTEKMDGGNLTFYKDNFHGRSLSSGTHAWDSAARALWGKMRFDIPDGWRISGESMYARRSVSYESLPSVYLIFGIWNEKNELLSWDETTEWSELFGIPQVPVLHRGNSFNEAISIWKKTKDSNTSEGFVLRNADSFPIADFENNIAKYVRSDHVRTRADWRHRDDFATNTFKEN